jgi:hypothetical protein
VAARLEEKRHVGHRFVEGKADDIRANAQVCFVSSQREWFAGGGIVGLVTDFLPYRPVDCYYCNPA